VPVDTTIYVNTNNMSNRPRIAIDGTCTTVERLDMRFDGKSIRRGNIRNFS